MARRCDTVGSTQSSLAVPFLDLLSPQHVRANFAAADKSQLLEKLAAMLASNADERRLIGEALGNREKLGSTGIGHGVAIPHGRVPGLDRARGVFVRLARPLAFGAIDEQPVDLVAAMAVPEHNPEQHLHLLAELAEMFSDSGLTAAMRSARDSSALQAELAEFSRNRLKSLTWTD